ncbi:MAG: hypothetical protein KAY24_05235, partial [Candidatus Eisenbacteria sp.]|nr:hypothetical protein [Candidatus Eisenbacteria bacterium]
MTERIRFQLVRGEQKSLTMPAAEVIANIGYPPSPKRLEDLKALIDAESRQVALDCIEREKTEHAMALRERDRLSRESEETHQKLTEEEKRRANAPRGSVVRAAIFGGCAVACFLAEFALTWYTLPFVLNIRQHSILGVMVALAPASALAILEVIIARLFEHPWQSAQSAMSTSRMKRATAVGAMVVFLLVLGAGNVTTVIYLAQARENAALVRQYHEQGGSAEQVELDTERLQRAIVAVSLV